MYNRRAIERDIADASFDCWKQAQQKKKKKF